MSTTTANRTDDAVHLTLRLLEDLFGSANSIDVGVSLWDGTRWPDDAPHAATLVLKHPGALRAMLLPGNEVNLAEAYLYDDFDIEGNVESLFSLADALTERTASWLSKLRAANDLLRLPSDKHPSQTRRGPAKLTGPAHSIERDRQAVTFHYDVSNDFYALWLDRRMVYSCAYFQSNRDSLDDAQGRKLEYICRKLRLKAGQQLLDVGCGWGGLAMYAAQHYGVDATGITLSEPQARLASERIAAAGLANHCRVQVCDYRQVNEAQAYDAIVSVGMFEHVGATMLATYFDRAYRLLKPGGVFLNHGISGRGVDQSPRKPGFVDAYVFPDGELVPIYTTLRAAESAKFEVRDVESLREHYTLTLRHWVRRLEAHHGQALEFVDEPTFRVWRLFMSGSAYGFATGDINVYQTLLVKPDKEGQSGLPLTRADWY